MFELNFDSGYTFDGVLAGVGQSIIVKSSGAVGNYVGYSTGVVNYLGFGTSTSGLSSSGAPIISLLIGLDTNNKTFASSTFGGLNSVRSIATQSRLNLRDVQCSQ